MVLKLGSILPPTVCPLKSTSCQFRYGQCCELLHHKKKCQWKNEKNAKTELFDWIVNQELHIHMMGHPYALIDDDVPTPRKE